MIDQYATTGPESLLIVRTDHAVEAVPGFDTEYGDGSVDLTPRLTKTEARRYCGT